MTVDASQNMRWGLVAALITVILWAGAFPAIRVALNGYTPLSLAAVRYAIAAAIMLGWLALKRPPRLSKRTLLQLIICAATGISAYNILLIMGEITTPAGVASLIMGTVPIMAAIVSTIFLKEPFNRWA